jgi:hypothetical protein
MAISQEFKVEEVKPLGNSYFKPLVGANKIRIISNMTSGYEAWFEDAEGNKKPTRQKHKFTFEQKVQAQGQRVKTFVACVVYNYATGQAEEWVFTQASIIDALRDLRSNADWGNLKSFDITITRTGAGMDTKYTVTPSPKKAITFADEFEHFEEDVNNIFLGQPMFSNDEPVQELPPLGEQDADKLFNAGS